MKKLGKIFLVGFGIFLIIGVGALLSMNFYTNKKVSSLIWCLEESNRLDFWVTYISAIISSLIGIIGVAITIQYYRKKDAEEKKSKEKSALIQIKQEYRLKYIHEMLEDLVEFDDKIDFMQNISNSIICILAGGDVGSLSSFISELYKIEKENPEMGIESTYRCIHDISKRIKNSWLYKVSLYDNSFEKLKILIEKIGLIVAIYELIKDIIVDRPDGDIYDIESATEHLLVVRAYSKLNVEGIGSIVDISKELDDFCRLIPESIEEVKNEIKRIGEN